MIRVFFGVPESYGNSPGRSFGPYWAIRERERGYLGQAARPPRPSPNWTRGRGRTPSFLPFSLPVPCLLLLLLGRTPSWTRKGGNLLQLGVRILLPGAPLLGPASSPLAPLYTGAGGHPRTHKLIYGSFLSRVRCPPPPYSTSVIS